MVRVNFCKQLGQWREKRQKNDDMGCVIILAHLLLCYAEKYPNTSSAVSKSFNTNIVKVLRLTREMMLLADQGDSIRQDRSGGVLYGTLRDAAYKLRQLAEEEKDLHIANGIWDID